MGRGVHVIIAFGESSGMQITLDWELLPSLSGDNQPHSHASLSSQVNIRYLGLPLKR